MSGNGIYACDSINYYRAPFSNDSARYNFGDELRSNLHFNLYNLRYQPSSRYDLDFSVNSLNAYNSIAGQPYTYSVSIPYGSTRFGVHSSTTPEYLLNGQMGDYFSVVNKRISQSIKAGCVKTNANQISIRLSKIKGMAGWVEHKFLSEESKNQAQAIMARCKKYETLLNAYLGDPNALREIKENYSELAPSVENIENISDEARVQLLLSLLEKVKAFDEEVKALDEQLRAEAKDAEIAQAGESAEGVEGAIDSSDAGVPSITTVEGDTKMNNAQLATRYGVKAPVVAEMSPTYVSNITNAADSRSSFTTELNALSNKNVVSFLVSLSDSKIDSLVSDIDSQSYWSDDDEKSMKELLSKFDGAFEPLKNAGYLTKDEYNQACELIADSKAQVKDSFTDSEESKIKSNLRKLKELLSVKLSDGTSAPKGSQAHFEELIKQKQQEATTSAIADFRKAYAKSTEKSKNPVAFDENANYGALPEEITYLPNKKVFQVKLESKTFQGKDFSQINSKIMKCKDEAIILSWIDLKKELITASATQNEDVVGVQAANTKVVDGAAPMVASAKVVSEPFEPTL